MNFGNCQCLNEQGELYQIKSIAPRHNILIEKVSNLFWKAHSVVFRFHTNFAFCVGVFLFSDIIPTYFSHLFYHHLREESTQPRIARIPFEYENKALLHSQEAAHKQQMKIFQSMKNFTLMFFFFFFLTRLYESDENFETTRTFYCERNENGKASRCDKSTILASHLIMTRLIVTVRNYYGDFN